MRLKHTLILAAVFLIAAPIVYATGTTTSVGAVRFYENTVAPCKLGNACFWWDGDVSGPKWRAEAGNDITMGAGVSLSTANTWTAAQRVASVALTDGASIATNAALGNTFTVTLGGNRTLANPTNLVSGGEYTWVVSQDATGSRTLAYGAAFAWPGTTAPTLTTTAAAVDIIRCNYAGTTLRCTFNGGSGGGGSGDMLLGTAQTVTAAKTFNAATLLANNAGNTFATTMASAATAARTWTLPDATDTGVGLAAVQTLTNKSMSGGTNTFSAIPQSAITNLVSDLAAKLALTGGALTGAVTLTRTSVGAVQNVFGLSTLNSTAAADGVQQYSPIDPLCGNGWKTNATAASVQVCYGEQVRPVQGTTNPTVMIDLLYGLGGAVGTPIASWDASAGALVVNKIGDSTSFEHAFPSDTSVLCSTDATQTLSAKTLTAPVINGLTSSGSTAIDFSGNSGAFKTSTGAGTFGGSSNSFVAAIVNTILNVLQAATAGLTLANTTAAATGTAFQQFSPMLALEGQGWKTDATAASQTVGVGWQARPVEGTATPSVLLDYMEKIGTGAYTKRFSLGMVGGTSYYGLLGATGNVAFYSSDQNGFLVNGNDLGFRTNGGFYWTMTGPTFISSDGVGQIGTTSARVLGVRAYSYDTKMGAQLTAAATITPTAGFHHVAGATTIDTIAVTNLAGNPTLTIAADGGTITISAAGNVLVGTTIAINRTQRLIYDLAATKWMLDQ